MHRASHAALRLLMASAGAGLTGCRPSGQSAHVPTAATEQLAVLAHELTASYEFRGVFRHRAAVRIDSSRVAILDYPNSRVVVVDTTGAVVNVFGRKGGGPGEFRNPERLARTETTLFVYDGLKFAFVRFDLGGDAAGDVIQTDLLGPEPPESRPTGMAALADGSWVYSTLELGADGTREALYRRTAHATQLLARTEPRRPQTLTLPCGITIQGGPPVFTPTLRWDATGTRVAYATTVDDEVVLLDVATGDSTIVAGTGRPRRANRAAALAITTGYSVTTPNKRCELSPEDELRQRGMAPTMPVIDRLAMSPSGSLWVRQTSPPGDSAVILIHGRTTVDTLLGGGFPAVLLTDSRFLVEGRDSSDAAVLSLWALRHTGRVH